MAPLFFYGTLRYAPLLDCVSGRDGPLDTETAALPGYVARASLDGLYPVLREAPGALAHGVVVRGLTDAEVARLNYYEGGFDYDLRSVVLASGEEAQVYVPGQGVSATDAVWDFDAWQAKWAQMTLWASREVMAGYGHLSPAVIAARFPRIRARAWSKVLAQSGRHGRDVLDGRVEVLSRSQGYVNFFALEDVVLRHETFDGGMSEPMERGVFVSSDAALVLPYDPARDRVLLVEQIRMGPIGRDDPVRWQLEPVAGLVDPGETPEEAARREGQEEAGLDFGALEPVGECYASPGATTDFFHMFVGLCDLPDGVAGIGGEEAEGENIRSHVIGFDALLAMADDRRIANAPLGMLTYWLHRHRDRLRGMS
ncbi:NUDIX domain-containing protein [Tateyamaria omphalii]|uniref:ADP-ribose pyrophosphatase n=1 Tax=Tateyamaria omphalii TaxID=299262 RepID=A0A1P8MTJ5_9RHOB|nr:NUDIX domain-containing protein [Tateyamaria omphalii]APX11427.1 tellurium resistance protein [Tateyamaria omphalii]